jgi:hypothetical protein
LIGERRLGHGPEPFFTMFFEGAKQLGQDTRGLKLTMGGGEQLPTTTPGLSQLGQQLLRNLADRLRFTREFRR